MPAGFYSDDEYVSEDDEKDTDVPLPTRKFQGVQPPPSSRDISTQSFTKDTSNSSCPTAFTWTRNTCALRAPGTDPMVLRKEFITVNESRNVTGLNTGKGSTNNPTTLSTREHCADQNNSNDNVPFGVPRRQHAKERTDMANSAWVEKVLNIKSRESVAPRGSLAVRMETEILVDELKLVLTFVKLNVCYYKTFELKVNLNIKIALVL